MSKRREFLGVIPARGGSKGIPRKNIKDFLNKPLIAWTVKVARESDVFSHVILSTDDEEIAEIGRSCGAEVPFLRPPELAKDTTSTVQVVRHVMDWLRSRDHWVPRFAIVLEPTSPGRQVFHIRETADLLSQKRIDSVASISEVPHHFVPPKILIHSSDGMISGIDGTHVSNMIHRRQELPKYYAFDGLIFACKTDLVLLDPPTLWGENVAGYLVASKYSVDIDQPEDWILAETRLQHILTKDKNGS